MQGKGERHCGASEMKDTISAAASTAKAKILTVEAKVEKKSLQSLADATEDEITAIAGSIENGTYEKQKTKTESTDTQRDASPVADVFPAGTPQYAGYNGNGRYNTTAAEEQAQQRTADTVVGVAGIGTPLPPGIIISIITGELYHTLLEAATGSTNDKTKEALRAYIDTLEDIYSQI